MCVYCTVESEALSSEYDATRSAIKSLMLKLESYRPYSLNSDIVKLALSQNISNSAKQSNSDLDDQNDSIAFRQESKVKFSY